MPYYSRQVYLHFLKNIFNLVSGDNCCNRVRGNSLEGSSDYAQDTQGTFYGYYSKQLGTRLIIVKSLHQSIKIFVKLDFSTNILAVLLIIVYFEFCWVNCDKRSLIWLIHVILLVSELMPKGMCKPHYGNNGAPTMFTSLCCPTKS